MLLRYALIVAGLVLFGSTGAIVAYDVYLSAQLRRLLDGSLVRNSGRAARPGQHIPRTNRLVLVARGAERGAQK